jgi:Fic family protein
MQDCLDAFFGYLHGEKSVPVLVEAAWAHYQFEAIHPFNDGNGRVGRLLIPLLLAWRRRLDHPLLYLSPSFERRRTAYYDHLFEVSARSTWREWLRFFLEAVVSQSERAVRTARAVIALQAGWRQRLLASGASPTALRLAELVLQQPALNARLARLRLEQSGRAVSAPAVYAAIRKLEQAGILEERTGRARDQVWLARELTALLDPERP